MSARFLLLLAVGMLIGAAVAMLVASDRGAGVRRRIARRRGAGEYDRVPEELRAGATV